MCVRSKCYPATGKAAEQSLSAGRKYLTAARDTNNDNLRDGAVKVSDLLGNPIHLFIRQSRVHG